MDLQGIFRIIQSIPSKKAEPFKRWLARVGAERDVSVATQTTETFEKQTSKKVVSNISMKRYIESQ